MVQRIPSWVDWIAAVTLAIVLLNLNVTTAGDPLSLRVGGSPAAGISEPSRSLFYATIAIGGAILTTGALVMATGHSARRAAGRALLAAAPLISLAGLLGLLLDYRDGPTRTVQLFVYVALTLVTMRVIRAVAIVLSDNSDESSTLVRR